MLSDYHQDGFSCSSGLQSSTQEDQLATIHGQNTRIKILEHRCETETIPWPTETKKDHNGRRELGHRDLHRIQCEDTQGQDGLL